MDLAEFLLARIAEDETESREALPGSHLIEVGIVWDPIRQLAECDAKRRIVEHEKITAAGGDYIPAIETTWTLRVLALPHASHPDYRDEWKP